MENNGEATAQQEKIGFFLIVLFILVLVEFSLYRIYDGSNGSILSGITVEAFGFMADILLFGVLITWYDSVSAKKQQINRYLEELDDYRGWTEKEASYRIFGLLKRLFKLKVYDIDLTDCYFQDIEFSKHGFEAGFDFYDTLFYGTTFENCNIQLANFSKVKHLEINDFHAYCAVSKRMVFKNCNMRDARFSDNAYMDIEFLENDFNNGVLANSEFTYCIFDGEGFKNVVMIGAKFIECTFRNIDFSNMKTIDAEFIKCTFDLTCENIPSINE